MDRLRKRRSVRKYLDKPVESEKIDVIVEALLRSPSSRGFNPWEFVVVTDINLLEKLSKSKPHGSSFLKNAHLGIVVCADPRKCDTWIEDTSIASVIGWFTAETLGLGSCWIQIRERMHNETKSAEEYIAETLNIPPNHRIESIIAAGYPDETKPSHKKEELQYDKVKINSYYNLYSVI